MKTDDSKPRPRRVAATDLFDPGKTSGVTRLQAFAEGAVWVGALINEPHEMSKWHSHPGHETYAYVVEGNMRIEFGPGGSEFVELGPGDFAYVPRDTIHREGNSGHTVSKGVIVRIGEGPVVVDAEGPEVC